MTRSSTSELFTPYKEHQGDTLIFFDDLRSPDFNLLSDQEYSEEEEAEAMAETMEQYMSKTRTDYGSGVARPKIDNKDQFELKGQFLKELRENTFSGSDNEDANEHIEKVLEIVDLFHVPNITVDQLMLRVFPISLTGAASRWLRNEPTGSIKTWEDLKTKFLNKYCPPGRTAKKMEEINNFQQESDETLFQAWERFKELLMKGTIPTKTAKDAKKAIQEMDEYSQKRHNRTGRSTETSNGLAAIQAQLNNLGREIKKVNEKVYAAQVGCEQCKGPHYTKDYPQKEEGKTLEEDYYTQFGGPFQGGGYRATTPSLRERMELDLEARLMGETLVLNRSLDPFLEDYIELKDLNEPFELRRNQGDDLMPTIKEGENFSVMTDFAVLEDMDAYRDEGMGDIIVGEHS
ncbi:homeodomain-like protein [Tanacetum coccineum]